jgi:hypothetical protein
LSRISRKEIKQALLSFRKKKTFTVEDVVSLLECSIPTVRLKLRQWGARSSYNKSGQYYALPEVPRFDENGLWWFKGAYFSKYGTLKNTVVHLVRASAAGLSGEQIGELVGLAPRSFLHHFRDTPGLRREKHQGVYVYFSDDEVRYSEQTENRLEDYALDEPISDADAIVILVALIKHHGFTADHLAELPEVKECALSVAAIDRYLRQHDLGKKTQRSKR